MLVHARDQSEILATRFQKRFPPAHPDLFQRFQAVRNKCRADHQYFFDAAGRKFLEFKIRVRLQPRVFAKSRLEGHGVFFLRHARLGDERRDGLETLRAVTRRVRRAGHFATVRHFQAMAAGRVGLAQMPLRDAVKTEQQMVVAGVEMIFRARHQRRDVIRRVEIRRLDRHGHGRRHFCREFLHAHGGRFVARHSVMREQRDDEQVRDLLFGEFFQRAGNRRILIAHRQFHRWPDALLQFRPHLLARGNQR